MPIEHATLDAEDGARLHYRSLSPAAEPKGGVLISHGYAEHGGRYEGLMQALAAAGYASIAPDHRGHGMTASVLGLVDSFDALVADLSHYRERLAITHPGRPIFMIGHSMGGMATLLHIIRHAPQLEGAVLIAPAIEVPDDIPGFMITVSKVLSRLTPKLAVQPFFDPTALSTLPEVQQAVITDPLFYRGKIRARTGAELYAAMVDVNATMGRVEVPLRLLHGEEDSLVKPRVSETVMSGVRSSEKSRRVFPKARHEILHEACEQEVLADIIEWLDGRVAG